MIGSGHRASPKKVVRRSGKMDTIFWYLSRVKESDLKTRRWPLYEDLPEHYPDMASAMAEADRRNDAHDGYQYSADFARINA